MGRAPNPGCPTKTLPRHRHPRRPWTPSRSAAPRGGPCVRRGAPFVALGALLAVVLPGAVAAAWPTNTIELDAGSCGHILQLGSDRTASSTATPTFMLYGDGGLSSYVVSVDGKAIGTFYSSGRGVVCIDVTTPLADGPHTVTAVELAPRPTQAVTPLAFSVDTVLPPSPSSPALSGYTDSGVKGDGITRYGMVNFTGTADPVTPVQIFRDAMTGIGGTKSEADGSWSATSVGLADGTYTITAVTLDSAGNKSVPSPGTRITIDSVPPATPGKPSLDDTADGPMLAVRGTAAADVATIRVYCDGGQIGAATPDVAHNWRLTLPSLPAGAHDIAVTAADAADNVTHALGRAEPRRRRRASAASAATASAAPAAASPASGHHRAAAGQPASRAGRARQRPEADAADRHVAAGTAAGAAQALIPRPATGACSALCATLEPWRRYLIRSHSASASTGSARSTRSLGGGG